MNTARFKERLKQSGYTQARLAEKIGVAPNTVSRYVANQRAPSVYILHDIAKTLGVTMEYLIEEDEDG